MLKVVSQIWLKQNGYQWLTQNTKWYYRPGYMSYVRRELFPALSPALSLSLTSTQALCSLDFFPTDCRSLSILLVSRW